MILTPQTPGAKEAKVFDAVTGEEIRFAFRVNTDTWMAKVIRFDSQGWAIKDPGDETRVAIFDHPNPVRVEWPGLEELLAHKGDAP